MIYFKKVNFLAKLKIIFSPPPETGEKFMCKSVMYYYNEQVANITASLIVLTIFITK